MTTKRRRWREHWREVAQVSAQNEALDAAPVRVRTHGLKVTVLEPVRLPYPPFPDDLRGLTCGARTRAGSACKRVDLYTNGRCKLHGGLSSGPKTKAGKRRALENLRARWKPNPMRG